MNYDQYLESCCDEGHYSEREERAIEQYLEDNGDEWARDNEYINLRDIEAISYNKVRDVIYRAMMDTWRLHDYKDPVVIAVLEQYRFILEKKLNREMSR